MVFRMSKIGVRITILFLIFISLLSCTKKSKKLRPYETEYELKLIVNYYIGDILDADGNAISVNVYKSKDDVDNDEVFMSYNLKDFISGAKPVSVIENYEVVIELVKENDTVYTDISGDGSEEFIDDRLQFTMNTKKSFIITFSNAPIEKVAVTFEALKNGSINVAVKADVDVDADNDKEEIISYNIKEGTSRKINFVKLWFSDYKILAMAKGDNEFKGWSGGATGNDNPLEILESMKDKTITANFLETPITINFEAGANGSVYVDFLDIDDTANVLSNKQIAAPSGTGSITISKSLLETQKIEVRAVADADCVFEKWSGGASGNENPVEIKDTMDGQTITASFKKTIITLTFTFTAGANGSIYLYFTDNSTGSAISNMVAAGPNSSKTLSIVGSLLSSQKVEAVAIGLPNYGIDKWNNVASDTVAKKEIDFSSPTTLSATFKTATIDYGTASTTLGTEVIGGNTWYQIKTPADLLFVANKVDEGDATYASGKYKIMDNIDYNGGYHKPIGDFNKPFKGVINGNGMTIKNAKYGQTAGRDAVTGFVGYMEYYPNFDVPTISDLTIDSSVVINSGARYTGGIAGSCSDSIIVNCVNKANISVYNTEGVGGIVGYSQSGGEMSNVYNTGNIDVYSTELTYIGGVVGVSFSLPLVNAYNTGDVYYSGTAEYRFIGGVVGYFEDAFIKNVYSTGKLGSKNDSTSMGGIAGDPYSATTLANMYFVNASGLPTHGFGSTYAGTPTDRTVANAGVSGTASWADVLTAFNAASPNVWKAGPLGRPVIDKLGEGK